MFPARDVAAAAARACRRDSGGGSALLSARLSLPAAAAAGCLRRHPELVSAGVRAVTGMRGLRSRGRLR